jgi:hypothetical protein
VPALALVDPHLPALVLDRQRMKAAIQAGRGTNPHKNAEELSTLDTRCFTGCPCCGLALTVQSMANNHFGAIGRLLRYPEWYADTFWLGLVPKVVAAVLLQKVIALRGLVQRRR